MRFSLVMKCECERECEFECEHRVVHGDRIVVNCELDLKISYDFHWLRFSRWKSNYFQILPYSQSCHGRATLLVGKQSARLVKKN